MNKKGALELSINAIVVLILAITILGLGIGFIKSQFGGLSEQFTQVRAEIRDQLIQKIRESGDLLVFNRAELEVTTGKSETFYIGIKGTTNDPDEAEYEVGIRCIQALTPVNQCTSLGNDVVVGGKIAGFDPASGDQWFQMFSNVQIQPGEVGVYPVTVQISGPKPDTYAMEMVVYEGKSQPAQLARKQFFVVLR